MYIFYSLKPRPLPSSPVCGWEICGLGDPPELLLPCYSHSLPSCLVGPLKVGVYGKRKTQWWESILTVLVLVFFGHNLVLVFSGCVRCIILDSYLWPNLPTPFWRVSPQWLFDLDEDASLAGHCHSPRSPWIQGSPHVGPPWPSTPSLRWSTQLPSKASTQAHGKYFWTGAHPKQLSFCFSAISATQCLPSKFSSVSLCPWISMGLT